MKHIGFDESSVLQEFARIAVDKGMVKMAEATGDGAQYFVEFAAQIRKIVGGGVAERYAGSFESLAKQTPQIPLKDAMFKANEVSKSQGGGYVAAKAAADAKFNAKLVASTSADLTKEGAGEKCYDVSGETGEKLVDSAHPDGSPEVTVPNTKEVVETIVDQQKADIAVVEKKPHGKYAALVILADELDAMGLHKHAEKIDGMLKKLAVGGWNDPYPQAPAAPDTKMPDFNPANPTDQSIPEPALPAQPTTPTTEQSKNNQVRKGLDPKTVALFKALYNRYADLLAQANKQSRTDQQNHQMGKTWPDFNTLWKQFGGIDGMKKSVLEVQHQTQQVTPSKGIGFDPDLLAEVRKRLRGIGAQPTQQELFLMGENVRNISQSIPPGPARDKAVNELVAAFENKAPAAPYAPSEPAIKF
jgi:hypothetical protein